MTLTLFLILFTAGTAAAFLPIYFEPQIRQWIAIRAESKD